MINDAISGIQTAQTNTKTATKADYEQQKTAVQDAGAKQLTAAQEGSANLGAASSYAILSQVQNNTAKQLKDLDLREQQALATGDQQAAQSIANLKVQQLQFQQEVEQKTFTNLLSLAGIQIQAKSSQLQEKQQNFAEQSAMANMATQFGVALKPGDTLESLTKRVMPLASQQQKLQIAKMQSEINLANAQAAKALRGDATELTNSPIQISALASTYQALIKDPNRRDELNNFLATLQKNPAVYSSVINKIAEANTPVNLPSADIKKLINQYKNAGKSREDVMAAIASDQSLANKSEALKAVDELYSTKQSAARLVGAEVNKQYVKPVAENLGSMFGGAGSFISGLFSGQ
jgi:hypothetical protein